MPNVVYDVIPTFGKYVYDRTDGKAEVTKLSNSEDSWSIRVDSEPACVIDHESVVIYNREIETEIYDYADKYERYYSTSDHRIVINITCKYPDPDA